MKRTVKSVCLILIFCCTVLMTGVVYGFYALPDEFNTMSDEEITIAPFYSGELRGAEKTALKSVVTKGEYKLDVKLLNAIPVKVTNLKVSSRPYVVPSGEIVGLRLFTKGVMVVGFHDADTWQGRRNPANEAGILKGDVITHLDGKEISSSSQAEQLIRESQGKSLTVDFVRNGKREKTILTPLFCENEKKFKTGLWIRDSAAGIGTLTFFDKESGLFACLGHAVCDIDTGDVLPLADGDIVDATVSGCVKGKQGRAGELCGSFINDREGIIYLNDPNGVYGILDEKDEKSAEIPIAAESEIKEGEAQIISTVEGESKAYYDIEIEKLDPDSKDCKNIIIKITDEKLLEKTGGIVQGMSGSPIIQDGKLIGAVTHVFVNDPTRGYGIFAQIMLEKMKLCG